MPTTLSDILEATRRRVGSLRERRVELDVAASSAPAVPAWTSAFDSGEVAVIAEVKRRSPSEGLIRPDLDPAAQANAYWAGGARAVSVLTEPDHFGGSMADLEAVRGAVEVPILRKDFIVDPIQLLEAKAHGASAILLIVRALDGALLDELSAAARELGLGRLVEVHAHDELDRALKTESESVGVNSRDLATFNVRVDRLRDLLANIPSGVVAVAESGLSDRVDVERVAEWGADAVLVGTALARAPDTEQAVRAMVGVRRQGRRR